MTCGLLRSMISASVSLYASLSVTRLSKNVYTDRRPVCAVKTHGAIPAVRRAEDLMRPSPNYFGHLLFYYVSLQINKMP